jgi:hypothetical protein
VSIKNSFDARGEGGMVLDKGECAALHVKKAEEVLDDALDILIVDLLVIEGPVVRMPAPIKRSARWLRSLVAVSLAGSA